MSKKWGKPKGLKSSEEVKRKISEGVKKAYLKYKEAVQNESKESEAEAQENFEN